MGAVGGTASSILNPAVFIPTVVLSTVVDPPYEDLGVAVSVTRQRRHRASAWPAAEPTGTINGENGENGEKGPEMSAPQKQS